VIAGLVTCNCTSFQEKIVECYFLNVMCFFILSIALLTSYYVMCMFVFRNTFTVVFLCNLRTIKYTQHHVSKNDNDVAHYNFNQLISVIFGRVFADRVCCRTVICYPTSSN